MTMSDTGIWCTCSILSYDNNTYIVEMYGTIVYLLISTKRIVLNEMIQIIISDECFL